MVLPAPEIVDERMDEAKAGLTLDQVIAFIQDAPPEFIDYIFEMLSQQGKRSAPKADPALNTAMESITPVPPDMR